MERQETRSVTRGKLAQLGATRLASMLLDVAEKDNDVLERLEQALAEHQGPGRVATESIETDFAEPHMVGGSPPMMAVFGKIRRYAATNVPVLITGETGTGKELAALALHERSEYSAGPFVPINCGGLPSELIASELFGYEKGAFTGASQRKRGRIEVAEGGTVFLDEIGDLPLDLQSHLLRFLQERTIDRLGNQSPITVNARVIAATNSNLEKAVSEGRFRQDLFYRLYVFHLEMPPLRERAEDIDLLSMYFLRNFSQEMGRPACRFDENALRTLQNYSWPGNVRELISCVRRAVVMADGEVITEEHLGLSRPAPDQYVANMESGAMGAADFAAEPGAAFDTDETTPLTQARKSFERRFIQQALEKYGQNVKRTAGELGISRLTLYRLMEKYEIQRH